MLPGTDGGARFDAGAADSGVSFDGGGEADAGPVDAGPVDAGPKDAGSGPTCWPFDRPSIATLRASPRKVFAHYFSPYPLSIDNKPVTADYYSNNYLKASGENGAWAFCGGLLRERPVSPSPWAAGVDYEEKNLETEVTRAIAIGLDGFTYDVLNPTPGNIHRTRLDKLLTAAAAIDPGFKIQLVPDMTASSFGGAVGGTDAQALAGLLTLVNAVGANTSVMHLPNGKLVLSPFGAERRNAAFWIDAMTQLAAAGYPIALVPMPVGSWASNSIKFSGVTLFGASSWGTRTVGGAASLQTAAAAPHAAGLIWMAPVAPQDSRPKNLNFTESNNSAAFRAQWDAVISSGADWIQLITWNDYSEDSEISPSSQTQTGFYDLSAYYTTWFKQGAQPAILRDAVYYFYRAHSMDPAVAPPDLALQMNAMAAVNGPTTSVNQIELVALLKSAGTLEIEIAGNISTLNVSAGIQRLAIPLVPGTPTFRIRRNNVLAVELVGATTINNTITYQDPLYHAGARPTCGP